MGAGALFKFPAIFCLGHIGAVAAITVVFSAIGWINGPMSGLDVMAH